VYALLLQEGALAQVQPPHRHLGGLTAWAHLRPPSLWAAQQARLSAVQRGTMQLTLARCGQQQAAAPPLPHATMAWGKGSGLAGRRVAAPVRPGGPGAAGRFADQPRDGARRREVRGLAWQCGLTGQLGNAIPDQHVNPADSARATIFDSLRDAVFERAWATVDLKRAKTSLQWFADFLHDTGRVPFVPMAHAGDLRAGVYNRETLESFAEYIRHSGSRRAGRRGGATLASDTIATYVSAVATLRGLEAHYSVTSLKEANVRQPKAMKRAAGGACRGQNTRAVAGAASGAAPNGFGAAAPGRPQHSDGPLRVGRRC
jgi:hypothetical protein